MTSAAATGAAGDGRRGQSHVIGVAILLGITVLSLGVLTASVGTLVESNVATADAQRVQADLAGVRPVATTGPSRTRVTFTSGRLRTVERTVRLLNDSGVVASVEVDGLVFESGDARVAAVAGAVTRGTGANARHRTSPPFAAGDGVLLVGAVRMSADGADAVSGSGETGVVLATDVSHDRRRESRGRYRVAVESATPAAWDRFFERDGATTTRRDFDGDGVPSAVGAYPGERVAYLVVHDLHLEVRPG